MSECRSKTELFVVGSRGDETEISVQGVAVTFTLHFGIDARCGPILKISLRSSSSVGISFRQSALLARSLKLHNPIRL